MTSRAHVIYGGRVQGVGFRYTARAVAQKYAVSGFVKNLTDGTVELVAEGEDAEVRQFLRDLDDRMSGFIGARTSNFQPPSNEFEGFTVRF